MMENVTKVRDLPQLNIRITPSLKRHLENDASRRNMTVPRLVVELLEEFLGVVSPKRKWEPWNPITAGEQENVTDTRKF